MATLKYLDLTGLTTYTTNLQNYLTANYQPKGSYAPGTHSHDIAVTVTDDDELVANLTGGALAVNGSITHAKKLGSAKNSTANGTAQKTPTYGGTFTFTVPQISANEYGHVTTLTEQTVTVKLPESDNTDTKVTNNTTTSKYYLTGSTSSTNTTGELVKRSTVYVDTDGSVYSNSKKVATEEYVDNKILDGFAANDAMVFKGTLGTEGTITALPTSGYSAGWTYKVITAGTYAGQTCEVGDMVICTKDHATGASNSDWSVVQNNIDLANTTAAGIVKVTNKLSSSQTLTSTNGSTADRFYGVQMDKDGKIFVNIPWTDTKVTAVGNHYTPSGGSAATTTSSGTTLTWNSNVITGITKDAAGHITGVTTSALPSNPNTTYTFEGGTNSFSVTPSGGTKQTVNITPSITNNVTYTGTLTANQVAVFNNTTGVIKASGFTIAKNVPSDAIFTDTKNTAGASNSSSKLFLIGATSQGSNPQTYSHDTAYVGTDGCVYSNNEKVATENWVNANILTSSITDAEINELWGITS